MVEPAIRASQVRKDIWQRREAIGIDLNASRDRSACVGTLDEQNTHATLLSTSFLRTPLRPGFGGGEIGNDVGEIKCRGDDGLGTVFVPLLGPLVGGLSGLAPQPSLRATRIGRASRTP